MPPVVHNRVTADLVAEMFALFGHAAADEARSRARRARDNDNLVNFCRWRDAERLIRYMDAHSASSTRH